MVHRVFRLVFCLRPVQHVFQRMQGGTVLWRAMDALETGEILGIHTFSLFDFFFEKSSQEPGGGVGRG